MFRNKSIQKIVIFKVKDNLSVWLYDLGGVRAPEISTAVETIVHGKEFDRSCDDFFNPGRC